MENLGEKTIQMPTSEAEPIRRRKNAMNFCKTMVEDGRSVGPQDCAENTQKSMQRTCERRAVDFDHMDNRAK